MPQEYFYKVLTGNAKQMEEQLNQLAQQGWRPVTMGGLSEPYQVAVIIEKRVDKTK